MLRNAPVHLHTAITAKYSVRTAKKYATLIDSSSDASVQLNCCSCTTVRGLALPGSVGCMNSMPMMEMVAHINCRHSTCGIGAECVSAGLRPQQ